MAKTGKIGEIGLVAGISLLKKDYLKFEEGREFVQSLGLKSQAEWANIVKRAESLLRSLLLQAKYTKNNGKAGDIG